MNYSPKNVRRFNLAIEDLSGHTCRLLFMEWVNDLIQAYFDDYNLLFELWTFIEKNFPDEAFDLLQLIRSTEEFRDARLELSHEEFAPLINYPIFEVLGFKPGNEEVEPEDEDLVGDLLICPNCERIMARGDGHFPHCER